MLKIRNATMADFEPIMKIYQTAQAFMSRSGNPTQWGILSDRGAGSI